MTIQKDNFRDFIKTTIYLDVGRDGDASKDQPQGKTITAATSKGQGEGAIPGTASRGSRIVNSFLFWFIRFTSEL